MRDVSRTPLLKRLENSRGLIIAAGVSLLLLWVAIVSAGPKDPALRKAVLAQMPPSIIPAWGHVTEVRLGGEGVQILEGIGLCGNLRSLTISNWDFYRPVVANYPLSRADLDFPYRLHPTANIIEDLRPLAALNELENLTLDGVMQVDDFRFPPPPRPTLRQRFCRRFPVLCPLIGGPGPSREALKLDARDQLDVIQQLPQLKELSLRHNDITELSQLEGMEHLEVLNLQGNPCKDVAPLATMRNLRKLSLVDTNVRYVGPLGSLHELEVLDLSKTSVVDLTSILGLPKLRAVNLFRWSRGYPQSPDGNLRRNIQTLRDRGVKVVTWPDAMPAPGDDWTDPDVVLAPVPDSIKQSMGDRVGE